MIFFKLGGHVKLGRLTWHCQVGEWVTLRTDLDTRRSTMSIRTDDLVIDGEPSNCPRLILGHGAGLPMDSPFMAKMAELLVARGLAVVRFEFPYMQKRRVDGKKRGPDKTEVLLECFTEVIERFGASTVVIGGKSLGGRMASMLADQLQVRGLVCLGYPFHPPRKPDKTRTAHLMNLKTPTLIVQGERDPFGTRDDVAGYALASSINVYWSMDGDHSFVPRKRSGYTEAGNFIAAADAVASFIERL